MFYNEIESLKVQLFKHENKIFELNCGLTNVKSCYEVQLFKHENKILELSNALTNANEKKKETIPTNINKEETKCRYYNLPVTFSIQRLCVKI